MMNLLITYRGIIYPWQCDHMGHMNVMWYTGKFDEASWYLLSQIGLTRAFLHARKCGLAAVQQNTSYRRELRAGDVISVRSGILEVREKAIQMFHEMRNEGTHEVAAFSTITGVYIDTAARRSCPIPQIIRDSAEALKVDQNKLYWTETLHSIPKPAAAC